MFVRVSALRAFAVVTQGHMAGRVLTNQFNKISGAFFRSAFKFKRESVAIVKIIEENAINVI